MHGDDAPPHTCRRGQRPLFLAVLHSGNERRLFDELRYGCDMGASISSHENNDGKSL
jgi:hypothetical protein